MYKDNSHRGKTEPKSILRPCWKPAQRHRGVEHLHIVHELTLNFFSPKAAITRMPTSAICVQALNPNLTICIDPIVCFSNKKDIQEMSAAGYVYKLKRMQVSQSYTDSMSYVLFTPVVQYISRPQGQSCTTERKLSIMKAKPEVQNVKLLQCHG